MKFGKKGLILLATVALLLIAAVPALAAPREKTVELEILNKTGEAVSLVLNGPGETQTVFINAGQTLKVEVVPGEYFYKYEACGLMTRAFAQVTENEEVLTLTKCAGTALSNIVIKNQTGRPMIVTLTGLGGIYGYWVPETGTTIQIPAGGYSYTSVACLSVSGIIKASSRLGQPLIWTWTCQDVTLESSAE
jgi:hypothetical protein